MKFVYIVAAAIPALVVAAMETPTRAANIPFSNIVVDLTYAPTQIDGSPYGLTQLPNDLTAELTITPNQVQWTSSNYWGTGTGNLFLYGGFTLDSFSSGIPGADAPYTEYRQPQIAIDFSDGSNNGVLDYLNIDIDDGGFGQSNQRWVYFSQYDRTVDLNGPGGSIDYTLASYDVSVSPVPLPGALVLFASAISGLAGLACFGARKRQIPTVV